MEYLRLKQQHGFGTTDDGLLPYDATKLPMQAGASIYADDHDAEEDEDRDIVGSDLKLDHDYAPHKSSQGREGIMSLQFQSMDGIHKDQDDDQEAKPERDYGVTAATKTSPISLGEKSKCKEGGMDGSYVGSTTSNIKNC